MGTNAEQIEFWNETMGEVWVRRADILDGLTRDFGMTAIDRLDPRPGEDVLDIGCGFGSTTLEIGRRASPGGTVTGLDISRPMLDLAIQRLESSGVPGVAFVEADVQTAELGEAVADAAFSRFGVMFFSDPVAAFANVARAVRPGGRLAFVAWQDPISNPWMSLPVMAAMQVLPPPDMPGPDEPGPFSLADAERTRGLLSEAGWTDIDLEPLTKDVFVPGAPEEAFEFLSEIGPLRRALEGAEPDTRDEVKKLVIEAMQPLVRDGGVAAQGTTWLVTARR